MAAGFSLRMVSVCSKTGRMAAETAVCRGLGIIKDGEIVAVCCGLCIIKDGEVVTGHAMVEFARRFQGQVDDQVLSAMRVLFQVNSDEDDAIDDLLIGHGGAAGLDHEAEAAGTATEHV